MSDIHWIDCGNQFELAIVARPRGNDWLADEILCLQSSGIQTLVSMLEPTEAAELGFEDERLAAKNAGLDFLTYPISDRGIPDDSISFNGYVAELARRLRDGQRVGIHCRASIGRATLACASALISLGWDLEAALHAVQQARGCPVPDTEEQREWIFRFGVTA
jgi:Polymorphic toxin system, DSP-PTPase phosphatase